jgi:hypothetical protein
MTARGGRYECHRQSIAFFVSTENFIEPDRQDLSAEECYRFCMDANIYATRLMVIGFCDDELPRPLIHVFRATELSSAQSHAMTWISL